MLATTALLSGCLYPETFDTSIHVNADTSYTAKFNGRAVNVMALMQMAQTKQPLSQSEIASMNADATKAAKGPGVKKFAYVGNARFDVVLDETHQAGSSMLMMEMVRVVFDKEGVMTIGAVTLKEKDKIELKKLGLTTNGTLTVELPKNAEVISTNATSKPKLFGLVGNYSWKIGSIDDAPMMRVRFVK